ncbi:hypothetical protein O1611_g566 [Lasiodiplodia mahajangana]|uniref:Uncharacterized protein n=1 Tax=Lasiodiplodia mahajangana TaxID=1108764 RepID=A0ACC2JZU5_9PEZI|nr:hypothetical protein O1611_g566 [Lasiodiplodia mahajangana]
MDLYDQLEDSQIECPVTRKRYIPLDKLRNMITMESVIAYNDTSEVERTSSGGKGGAEHVIKYAIRAFATLVLVGRQDPIRDIVSNRLTDEYLPLGHTGSGDRRCLSSLQDKSKTFTLPRDWRGPEITAFREKQWLFQAPLFDTTGSHLILHRECALPLLESGGGPIETTPSSQVSLCQLHPAHYQDGQQMQAIPVAIKEMKNDASFQLEKKNLEAIQNLNDPHLIWHIATCQIDKRYYVLFPLANGGSLLNYWEQKNRVPRSRELILWSLRQMLGLVGATRALHYGLEGQMHCRHGDLKPANILYFEKEGGSSLVIADLGVSSLHYQPTNIRTKATMTKATTQSYEAPEANDDERKNLPRSRTYDVWSLGCVFMEFVIWLLYDFDAILSFERNRLVPQNPTSSFYQLRNTGKAEIPETVLQAAEALRQDPRLRGGTTLEALVHLITEKLLVIEVEHRFNAKQLYDELRDILSQAEQGFLDLLKEAPPSLPTPEIFLPRTSFDLIKRSTLAFHTPLGAAWSKGVYPGNRLGGVARTTKTVTSGTPQTESQY